jgi:AbrB family looped-hinge helix DNA binding protein
MKTSLSSKGQIVLPAELRKQDRLHPGQQFEVERIQAGEYRITKVASSGKPGLLAWLNDCPEKDWFQSLPSESTDELWQPTDTGLWDLKFLVDANLLSEPTKEHPSQAVVDWLARHEADLAVNPIILGEIEYGILLLPSSRRRKRLLDWFTDGLAHLRVLDIDGETSKSWAILLADLRRRGRAMPIKDSLIAATALQYQLTVATRNTSDYRYAGVALVNPFGDWWKEIQSPGLNVSQDRESYLSALVSDCCFSLVTFFVLYSILPGCFNIAYAPEGKPDLGQYIAIRVFGVAIAYSGWQFFKFRRLRREESRQVPIIRHSAQPSENPPGLTTRADRP